MQTQTFNTASHASLPPAPSELQAEETRFGSGQSFPITVAPSTSPARSGVLAIGVWLGASAFLGQQPIELVAQSVVLGLLLCAAIFWRARQRAMQLLLIGTGAWLFTSSFFAPDATGWSFWNNEICAVALLALSFARNLGYRSEPHSMLSSGWA
jgi:hypothetical protein